MESEEDYWTRKFVETEGKKPETMWQLMQYAAIMQEQSKQHSSFWSGIFSGSLF